MLAISSGCIGIGGCCCSYASAETSELNFTEFLSSPMVDFVETSEVAGPSGIPVLSSLSSTMTSSSESDPDIIVFFRKDNMPYSKIERRANNMYNLMNYKKIKNEFGVIVATTKESANLFNSVFRKQRKDEILETLEIIESILKDGQKNY